MRMFLPVALIAASLAFSGTLSAQLNFPEIPFDAVEPLTLPPNIHLGEAAGVATNSNGDIFVYTRTGTPSRDIWSGRRWRHLHALHRRQAVGQTASRRRHRIRRHLLPDHISLGDECRSTADYLCGLAGDQAVGCGICISPGPHQYLFTSNSNPDSNPAASWETSGEIYMMELDGTVIGKFGRAGKALGQFQTVHGIDCRNPNELIVSEIAAWRVQKILLQPPPATDSSE